MRIFIDKYLPFFFWAIVIAAATWGSWIVVTGYEKIPVETVPTDNELNGEIPPAVVDQPILEEVSADGAVRWTLYLDRIIRNEGSVMELSKPRVLYRFQSGEILEVVGETGTYDEDAGVLNISGGVTGTSRDSQLQFNTEEMIWDSVQGLMTATGGVEIMREGLQFTGEEFRLDMSEQFSRLTVSGGVNVTSNEAAISELTSNVGGL
ncbi:MAG: LPS export ABC transporter periplasmic protein LptC [bacterium]|nr:LPS export ABC transporter periplasmic protein LptC [bacterium]